MNMIRIGKFAMFSVSGAFTLFSVLMLGCVSSDPTDSNADTTDTTETPSVKLYINEFMAQNDDTLSDPNGASGGYPDWIEIYNAGTTSVDMSGMFLTDDLKQSTMWEIPDGVVIPAGGYVLFYADNDVDQGSTHANFKLTSAGENIGLFDTLANGNTVIDSITFGVQTADVSYGRFPDGASSWQFFTHATPGQSNN